jgi:hypothetical protein
MMTYARALGLTLVVVLALSGMAATSAVATPEFLHTGKEVTNKGVHIMGKTVKMHIELGETKYSVTCTSTTSEGGVISGTTLVKNVKARFKGCRAKESEESTECEVNSFSPAGGKEEVITKTLKGKLGEVALSEASSLRGLKLEPATGGVFVTITGSLSCLPAETIEATGNLIGEVTPVKKAVVTAHNTYKTIEEKLQQIKKFKGETGTHVLEEFGVQIGVEGEQKVEFEETVEIT